ncbi:PAC2 family protein [Candidatus Woesearchaeota archaeon]|nr:PAC2 family protein [Candidatus Woesearchaeota archaeon]
MDKKWIIKRLKNIKFNKPIMIEGLPGMGNVAKITVDFIIESLKASKVYEISSYDFPNCVFINDRGIVELPKVEIYYKKIKGRDLFFVSGDMQPVNEEGCYEFCDKLLDFFQQFQGTEIITLGGIGLEEMPKAPKVYCTGTDKKTISRFTSDGIKSAEGVVGPIIGVSGLLMGLAKMREMKGTVLLVETLGIPTYLGVKEARELLKVLNKHLKLGLNMKELNKEVKIIESEVNEKLSKFIAHEEKRVKFKKEITNYIG